MGEKIRWPLATAEWTAKVVVADLMPFVERIEIVGSVRRRKPEVSDVELLFIPKVNQQVSDLFGSSEPLDLANEFLCHLESVGILSKRKSVTGHDAGWGPKNKLAVFVENGMPVDLFSEPDEQDWWRSLVIRTGPKDNNVNLITSASRRGVQVHAYGVGLTDAKTGLRIPCRSEAEFFKICGVEYLEPEDRR